MDYIVFSRKLLGNNLLNILLPVYFFCPNLHFLKFKIHADKFLYLIVEKADDAGFSPPLRIGVRSEHCGGFGQHPNIQRSAVDVGGKHLGVGRQQLQCGDDHGDEASRGHFQQPCRYETTQHYSHQQQVSSGRFWRFDTWL